MARTLEPTSYSELLRKLDGKTKKRLSANCTIELQDPVFPGGPRPVGIVLHWTTILTFWADGSVTFNSGGYWTATTKRYMGLAANHAQVFQRDFEWYILPMRVDRPRLLGNWYLPEHAEYFKTWQAQDKAFRKQHTRPFVDGCTINSDGEIVG